MRELARDDVVVELAMLDLEWGDLEDAEALVDLLLRTCTPGGAMIWLCFWDQDLGGVPLELLERGRGREVFQSAAARAKMHA